MRLAQTISLNGTWDLTDEILGYDLAGAYLVAEKQEGWIPTPVPGDIHQGLIAAGRIQEPLVGLNSFDCRWTEERSWWFRRRFAAEAGWLQAQVVELELNGLDSNAEIWLNGHHIGSHRNAFRPFVCDVKRWLQAEENTLLVRLTAGVETVSELDIDAPDGVRANTEAERGRPERGDPRRVMVRKPQYSFGWDWGPRVATTAIAGDVTLRILNEACIRRVELRPMRHGKQAMMFATVTVDRLHYYKTTEGTVKVSLVDAQGRRFEAERAVLLRSGDNFVELTIAIDKPTFWWPNGMGDQHLYRVEAELQVQGGCDCYPAFPYGLRFVRLDTQDKFAIVINDKKVFCKGGNWIPADAIYARVTAEKYDRLIREARAANFNMLRIWGGGLYERDAFYEACDRYGIMVWHDFMFSCAPYPDHLEWFRAEVQKEVDYQTKRLQRHACIVLWSGSNENNWGFRDWWHERTRGGAWTYNYAIPDAVRCNTPEIPYWNGSPYGGDEPNSSEVGDRHHWHDCMMNPDMNKRITPEEYDLCTSLFVSEFGYVGACSEETLLEYMVGEPLARHGKAWQHHTNTFEQDTVAAGIRKHYLPALGDIETLPLQDYLLYSGLCQGLMYAYALESMRYRENCHGSLFWMYDDCWGEVGWTIVDYYLRRKLSWWFVRRAFAPVRLILRPVDGDKIQVVAANDTQDEVTLGLEVGYVSLDGQVADLHTERVVAAPLARTALLTFARDTHNPLSGLWIARVPGSTEIEPALLRATDYSQLQVVDPGLSFSVVASAENTCTIRASCRAYAHAVHLLLPEGAQPSDDYFDLLPGQVREIAVTSPKPLDPHAIGLTCVNAR